MNESSLRTMLAERVERVEVGPAPLDDARREAEHMRRRRSILAASVGTVGVVVVVTTAALVIRPGSDASSLPTDSVSPTLDSRWQGTMRLEPPTAQPGATVSMYFPSTSSRGVAYSLAPWTGAAWADPEYYLTSDGGDQLGWTPGWWRVDQGGNRGWRDIGVSGPGPDRVVIPDAAVGGPYLLCTANAMDKSCALLTVSAQTTDHSTTLPGLVPTEDDLSGSWQIVTVDGEPVADSLSAHERTLTFARADWSGNDGCNSWFGHIQLGPDGTFSTWGDGSTLKLCPGIDAGPVPSLVMSANSVRLDGDTMTLYTEGGAPLATFEAVDDTGAPGTEAPDLTPNEYPDASDVQGTWDVAIAGNVRNGHQTVNTYEGVDMTMTFDGNNLAFNNGCNDYAGTFTLVHGAFATTTRPLTSRRCLAGTDTPLDDLVRQAAHATIGEGHLYLHAENFQILLSLTPDPAHQADSPLLDRIKGMSGKEVGLALGLTPITDPVVHGCQAFAQYAEGAGFCIDGVTDDPYEIEIILSQIAGRPPFPACCLPVPRTATAETG